MDRVPLLVNVFYTILKMIIDYSVAKVFQELLKLTFKIGNKNKSYYEHLQYLLISKMDAAHS